MILLRGAVGVLVGYLIMAVTSMGVVSALFADGGEVPTSTIIMSLVALAIGAAVGGFLCTLIAGRVNSPAIYVTIGVMLAMTGYSWATGAGVEPDWYKWVSAVALGVGFMVGASGAAYKLDKR